MGPFSATRNKFAYLLLIQDLFTKWIECCPLRKANGKKIREAIAYLVINRWGTPRVLLTDNGTEFVNRDLKALAEEFGIARVTVPPYHPQANPVERVNRVVKTMMTAFLEHDHRDWDIHLAEFRFAYNTAFHTSLQATPAFLNFGREPPPANLRQEGPDPELEVDDTATAKWKERMERIQALRDWVIENLDVAHQRQAHYYNQHRRDRRFVIGDKVLKQQHVLSAAQAVSAKLATKYHGPFTITRVLSPVVYELADSEEKAIGKIHAKDIKPYIVPSTP
ncbi:retrovirus-like pol polyprotein [Lasius niger]|uniref:Retrovirus-like pol polyprotein n=1 Tax=Lasius niger TaxID=67767 RepID=A0A0J7KB38_LASNI|nr:retrovirus-like pol polyprotein [Lasius niger]